MSQARLRPIVAAASEAARRHPDWTEGDELCVIAADAGDTVSTATGFGTTDRLASMLRFHAEKLDHVPETGNLTHVERLGLAADLYARTGQLDRQLVPGARRLAVEVWPAWPDEPAGLRFLAVWEDGYPVVVNRRLPPDLAGRL